MKLSGNRVSASGINALPLITMSTMSITFVLWKNEFGSLHLFLNQSVSVASHAVSLSKS